MPNNLEIWCAAKEVSGLLSNVITSYQATRSINHSQMSSLNESLRVLEYKMRAQHQAELARTHVTEIYKTQKMIDDLELYGDALQYAMSELASLHTLFQNDMEQLLRR